MKKSTSNFYLEAKKIWETVTKTNSDYTKELEFELEYHKRLLNFLQIGNYYYYVFNIFQGEFDLISESVKDVLGYEPEGMTAMFLIDNVHPDDKKYLLNYEFKSIEFYKTLDFDKIKKYKTQYDFRIKAKDGKYVRILQQTIQIDYDENNFYHSLGIHTDITHIKKDGTPSLSIIGLEGEPSYYNIQDESAFIKSYDLFTKREREILKQIVEGKSSKTIATDLNISLHTVNTHRKNILIKANCKSPIDLVTKVINEGWM